ncbi:universal stress protein [Spongisporangium articulatum]|uniref:Universal stress protein n=1 Tax=Spongisporangium articulatum TaxID=3362603 RepID=A0ABW8ALZ5_9ACTN
MSTTRSGATPGIIVVGLDGGEHGDDALRFALDEAARTGDTVEVITTWEVPAELSPLTVLEGAVSLDGLEAEARERQDAAVARVRAGRPETEISARLMRGDAGVLLVQAARNARLLVVGSRGLGPFRAVMLGSVGQYCARHAVCPVVVVPSHPGAATEKAHARSAQVALTDS